MTQIYRSSPPLPNQAQGVCSSSCWLTFGDLGRRHSLHHAEWISLWFSVEYPSCGTVEGGGRYILFFNGDVDDSTDGNNDVVAGAIFAGRNTRDLETVVPARKVREVFKAHAQGFQRPRFFMFKSALYDFNSKFCFNPSWNKVTYLLISVTCSLLIFFDTERGR